MTKLIVAFCSYATNLAENTYNIAVQYIQLLL